jgi:YgiT-type zinc finger domain-containing protein
MRCLYCAGEMVRGVTPFHVDRAGCHLTLDRLPAWLCRQCGEAYFEEGEVKSIQELVQAIEEKTQVLLAGA